MRGEDDLAMPKRSGGGGTDGGRQEEPTEGGSGDERAGRRIDLRVINILGSES